MATTLNLKDYTRNDEDPRSFPARVDLAADMAALDAFSAHVTASFRTMFRVSGSLGALGVNGGVIGSAWPQQDRVITNVVFWAESSGSGGVTTVDIQKQFDGVGGFASVFTAGAANQVILSASQGNYVTGSVTSFVSGTLPVWQAGKLLRAKMSTAAGDLLNGGQFMVLEVLWRPSGSYGV